ncbi:predicted protein [Histoplasma capsulatum H143]|uniref:Uncharacterized protein n=1 Tax=Ajellomyces capsulatus (strain H143) TaxID=544712 RepID=C6HSI9_AJECH|nr:predicted protein [Histoplasma capsulatum H143]
MAGKKLPPRRHGRPSRAATSRSDPDHEPASISSTPADLLKDLNSAVDKRNKDKWQKLRMQHRARVKKTEEGIQSMAHSNKLALMKRRKAQIKQLAELVKKRTELEAEIVADMQTLSDLYEAASGELQTILTSRLSRLK